jgi:signal transduction histidine kinase
MGHAFASPIDPWRALRAEDLRVTAAEHALPTVLVVDDTEGNRYTLSRLLRGAGLTVAEAASGAEAQAFLAKTVPDLVVLDINLPDITGHEVCREIKNEERTAMVPVMHVTASYVTNADRAFGLEHGADAYLTHPIDPQVFVATARALLRAGKAESERAGLLIAERSARAAAEEASMAKTQLLSTLSHELRTPLNSVLGHLGLVDAGVYGALTEGQRGALGRARRSALYLTSLIDDLLSFARLESGRLEYVLEDVVLDGPGGLLAEIEALVVTQASANGVTFTAAEPGPGARSTVVRADAEKLRIILVNLVTNAIKFTAPGGYIALSCTADPAAGTVRVQVRDTGRGIRDEEAARIFEPFIQVDRHLVQQSQQGVGLGLAISRTLARGMDGDLMVESELGVGSTFTLTMPHRSVTSPTRTAPASTAPASTAPASTEES